MKSYVINLARARDRRRIMADRFDALGLTVEWIEATDGRLLTQEERGLVDHDRRRRISRYPLSDNEVACYLSHCRAMRMLLDSGQAMAAIFEDDAILEPQAPAVIAAIEANGGPFDLIDLHRNFKTGERFAMCRPLLDGYALGRVGYTHMKLTAYVISRAGAERFLKSAGRLGHAVDKEIHRYWANGLDIYGLETPVAREDEAAPSFIDETRHHAAGGGSAYHDADSLRWRLLRGWEKLSDSLGKRAAFPAYVRRGRRPAAS